MWDMPGMNVGVYRACNPENEKVIIYLEGFDMTDFWPSMNRGVDEIYGEMILNKKISELQNFNYTYYVVDWKNSRIDMRFNALHLVNLIEKLKNEYKESDEQFVIIGESMGGLVGRYAMTYMESREYAAGVFTGFFVEAPAPANTVYLTSHPYLPIVGVLNRNPFLVPQMHKTRELITLDSPHQGANIPISIQILYSKATALLGVIPILTSSLNMGLGSYAAKQMLIYHMDGKMVPLSNVSGYLPAPQHATFFTQLKAMGDYPQFAKLMALSSGALDGTGQLDINGNERSPNDELFNIGFSRSYKLFGNTYPFFDAHLTLYTNPSGAGKVFEAQVAFFVPTIKIKLFGVTINALPIYLLNDTQKAVGVRPYCVSAGGNLFYNFFNQEIEFGFIPVQSALDYDNLLFTPLDLDIENENIFTKMAKTPFDVIMGYPNGINKYHLNYRNDEIYNITRDPAVNCLTEHTYFDADQVNYCTPQRTTLSLEIGDEEMYIENWILNRKATFQAEYDVRVNERNPYYEYPSFTNQALNKQGIYSKEKEFIIAPIVGQALFLHNYQGAASLGSFSSVGFSEVQLGGNWSDEIATMNVCLTPELIASKSANQNQTNEQFLLVYPNPNTGKSVSVNMENIEGSVHLQLVDLTGAVIYHWDFELENKLYILELQLPTLSKGLYWMRLQGEKEQITTSLIIE